MFAQANYRRRNAARPKKEIEGKRPIEGDQREGRSEELKRKGGGGPALSLAIFKNVQVEA